ncbi:Serine/arginine-rich splicing factor sc35 [Dionaea muscipula]
MFVWWQTDNQQPPPPLLCEYIYEAGNYHVTGKVVDGREIMVQFAKYGPNAERIYKGRIAEPVPRTRPKSRSPRRR